MSEHQMRTLMSFRHPEKIVCVDRNDRIWAAKVRRSVQSFLSTAIVEGTKFSRLYVEGRSNTILPLERDDGFTSP